MYDYVLGGGHNFAVDRALADQIMKVQPDARRFAIMNRAFLRRAVLFMVDAGIRQFLDLGSGIPTVGNVHEIAQQTDPMSRVVYVDLDHVAVAHSELILKDNEHAVMLQADIADPESVLGAAERGSTLNFDEPIGLLAITVGHYISDDQDPVAIFARYRDALASGSYLALTHLTDDFSTLDDLARLMKQSQNAVFPRTRSDVAQLFGDFELVEPGLVTTSRWHIDSADRTAGDPGQDSVYAGVARKP